MRECDTCQHNKFESSSLVGLLQPLPILERAWDDIFMDVIKGLPPFNSHTIILMVVDRLTKYAHFIGISHPYTA